MMAVAAGAQCMAQEFFPKPDKGVVNWQPAPDWNDASLIGNGDMGAMVLGNPYNETIIVNQHNIWLPTTYPHKPIDQVSRLAEIRELIDSHNGTRAAEIPMELAMQEGYGGQIWNDPYIPAFELKIKTSAANVEKYQRSVDFETGVCSVDWIQDGVKFQRTQFVSRKDSVMIVRIRADKGTFDANINLQMRNVNWDQWDYINSNIKKTEINHDDNNFLIYRSEFVRQWEPNIIGYEGFLKIKKTDGKCEYKGGAVKVTGATDILFAIKVQPLWFGQTSNKDSQELLINNITDNYDELLSRHVDIHKPIYNRVSFSLNGSQKDYDSFGEVMMQKSKVSPSNAFVQKQFEAARYNILCASGPNIPHLQGIWGNSWTPPWVSDYTNDGNVETAISSFLDANMKEFLMPFFDYHEKFMPYYKENARKLFGVGGIVIPSHSSSHGYNVHFDKTWCLSFWTGGAAWISQYFYDYWLYTQDINFLKTRAYPFMKQAVAFYEGFLYKDENGVYEFNPSYSPENNPKNNPSQACRNATMDVSMCKELLRNIIAVAPLMKENKAQVARWKKILSELPKYKADKDGFFKEWIDDEAEENHNHRHVSHLYGMYNMIDPEIAADTVLWNAVKKSYYERMKIRIQDGGGIMVFGLCQMSWIAANIGDKEMYKTIIDWLSAHYWTDALFTYHDPNGCFNCDLSGGFQNTIIKGLVYTEPGLLKIFPAKPDEWDSGEISGILIRGNAEIKSLKWNGKHVSLTIKSGSSQKIALQLPSEIATVNGVSAKTPTAEYALALTKDKESTIELDLK